MIDDDLEIIVESGSGHSSPSRVDIRLKQKRGRFSFEEVVLSERSYDFLKERLPRIRERVNCVRLDTSEALNSVRNCFSFNDGLFIHVGLKENRRVFVDFLYPVERGRGVTLNEKQFSALETMIARSVIDGAILRLWKCTE